MPEGLTADFDLPDDIIYLNTAGVGPRLAAVTQAAVTAVVDGAAPWRPGSGWLEAPEHLRSLAAETLGTRAEALAYIPSASYGFATAARNLPLKAGQRLLLMAGEYPSNRNIWLNQAQEVGAEVVEARPEAGEGWTEALLRHIDERTSLVSATPCFWTDGRAIDLHAISQRAREAGAALVVDASQSLGARVFDFDGIDADFVISAGHKWLLGAQGLGWLWAAPRWREQGEPLEQTWVAREGREHFGAPAHGGMPPYRPGARRYDFGGSLSPVALAASTAAMTQLRAWSVPAVSQRLGAITGGLAARLARHGPGARIGAGHVPHFLALHLPGRAVEVAEALATSSIVAAARGDGLRLAPHLHIRDTDLDIVADRVAALLERRVWL